MDMDMGSGGMSMGTSMFQQDNMALAKAFWYVIVGVLALLLIIRAVNLAQNWQRLRVAGRKSAEYPSKPTNGYLQLWGTLTAVGREMSYPQLYISNRWLSWMTPPHMGRILALLVYWAIIIYMMAAGAIVKDAFFWERIGFRNAWVTVMQIPLLYLLASKTNILALIAGTSYERLNWLHRWVARTMFVTATVHGFHFWTEWVIADFVELQLKTMPIIKYGLGGWAILLWMVVTSFKPFRSMAYEIFVAQHIVAAVLFLWVVYVHVPSYARYNVWFAVAAICFDRVCRLGLLLWQNIKLNPNKSGCKGGQWLGHQIQLSTIGDSITVVTIKDVHFKWRAGQHLYLWLPRVGPVETHPYTIACPHQVPETCICNSVQLVVRAHSGFSKRLHQYAKKMKLSGQKRTLTALVAGPYGHPPRWDIFETLMLISASTGTSFTLPILESVLRARKTICTKRIDFLLAARQGEEIGFYLDRLHEAVILAEERGIELRVHIAVTGAGELETISAHSLLSQASADGEKQMKMVEKLIVSDVEAEAEAGNTTSSWSNSNLCSSLRKPLSHTSVDSHVHHSASRPDIASFLLNAVEATGGETGVVVCGGGSLVARVRLCVAKLSDERAVHKGTGAQGIYLYVEEYAF